MHASRPLVALLIGTVIFFALWITALKPGSSGAGGSHPGLGQLQSAINKACAVPGVGHAAGCGPAGKAPASSAASKPASPAGGGATATTTNGATPRGSAAAGGSAAQGHSHSARTAKGGAHGQAPASSKAGVAVVRAALREHKVLALLFYNPGASDDRAVHQELASVPTHGGAVVKLAVPLQELYSYSTLLNEVPVNFSPTLVLINRAGQADEIMGFADSFEIDQRVAQALASHR